MNQVMRPHFRVVTWATTILCVALICSPARSSQNPGKQSAPASGQAPAAMGPTAAPKPKPARVHSRPGAGPPPRFVDLAGKLGLTASHISSPDKHYVIESMSGGIGLFDCDHDGRLDVVMANGSSGERYRRGGDP